MLMLSNINGFSCLSTLLLSTDLFCKSKQMALEVSKHSKQKDGRQMPSSVVRAHRYTNVYTLFPFVFSLLYFYLKIISDNQSFQVMTNSTACPTQNRKIKQFCQQLHGIAVKEAFIPTYISVETHFLWRTIVKNILLRNISFRQINIFQHALQICTQNETRKKVNNSNKNPSLLQSMCSLKRTLVL